MSAHSPPSPGISWSKPGHAALAAVTAVLAVHRLYFAFTNTPNILFWDQWGIYEPLFQEGGWWQVFSHQHGPHRQGVGFLFTAGLAHLTHWDARGDAVLTVGATIAAALLAFPLARLCGVRAGLALITVPLIFLTMRQFESWIGPSNPSHGAFPILLTVLLALSWFIRSQIPRLGVQVALTLFLVFTGFGLFAGALAPALLGIEAWRHWRHRELRSAALAGIACMMAIGIWALFFNGYQHQPAVVGFQFPHERPLEYVCFAALMFSSYAGWHGQLAFDLAGGFALMSLLAAVAIIHGLRVLRSSPSEQPESTVLFVLAAATLLFCLNTAVGRVVLGWREAPYAPRYVTLLAPGILALYLQAERFSIGCWRNGCRVALFTLVVWSGLTLSPGDRLASDWYRRGREDWKAAYLASGSQIEANKVTSPDQGFTIYPGDLTAKLEFLRQRRLNLFAPAKP